MVIDDLLVRRLVGSQFPHWGKLSIVPVEEGGWDNRSFRLGDDMVVRLPSAAEYADQVTKEQRWLPELAPLLPLPIPRPLALGEPARDYPWCWSIYGWVEGEPAAPERISDLREFASDAAVFLNALNRIALQGGPLPGPHNFHRGGLLATYDTEARRAIEVLAARIDTRVATEVWETAIATTWSGPPVWIHGDFSAGNLLVREGRLSAVIDFGMVAVGDPACDLAIAWTLLDGESRSALRAGLRLDADTWARGRGWALWKAMIVASGIAKTNAFDAAGSLRIIDEVLCG